MARANVELDLRGLEEIATSREMRAVVNDAAREIAEHAQSQGVMVIGDPGEIPLPVTVHEDETTQGLQVNRALAVVTLNHASGLAAQAKNGVLTKAASAAGLRVKGE